MRTLTRTSVAGLAIAMLALAGCTNSADDTAGSGSDDGKVTIGYVVQRGSDPFAADQVAAAQDAAKEAGVELLTADVKQDSALTISTVTQMITNGIDGLIIVVPDPALGPQILKLAGDAGIPVIASDQPISDADGKAAPFVGLDDKTLGTQAGDILAGLIKKDASASPSNSALLITSTDSFSACKTRTDAAVASFQAAAPDAAVYLDAPAQTLDDAITATSAAITQNPGIKSWYITGCNDDGVAGALRALEGAGVTKANSFGVGMDGSLACTELAKDNGFYGANYVSFRKNGEITFETMRAFLEDGTPIPDFQSIPGPLITRDNKADLAGC